jgi:hypothetical protein
MTAPLVHLSLNGGAGSACGRRAPDWSAIDTAKVDCERCRGTLRFTLRLLEERGQPIPATYRERMAAHRRRVNVDH